MTLHPGAATFVDWAEETLLIATGAMAGKYYELGKTIQRLLAIRGVESFVIHTDGSIENAGLLASGRPTLAIMQYDTALAARSGVSIYDFDPAEYVDLPGIPKKASPSKIASVIVITSAATSSVVTRSALVATVCTSGDPSS